jgi:hypothetical protein
VFCGIPAELTQIDEIKEERQTKTEPQRNTAKRKGNKHTKKTTRKSKQNKTKEATKGKIVHHQEVKGVESKERNKKNRLTQGRELLH